MQEGRVDGVPTYSWELFSWLHHSLLVRYSVSYRRGNEFRYVKYWGFWFSQKSGLSFEDYFPWNVTPCSLVAYSRASYPESLWATYSLSCERQISVCSWKASLAHANVLLAGRTLVQCSWSTVFRKWKQMMRIWNASTHHIRETDGTSCCCHLFP
jgi:hypothetical protein